MTQLATRDARASAPIGVITVADLLSRYSPASVEPEPEPDTVPVSVQSLLRREGVAASPADAGYDDAGFDDSGFDVTEYDPAYDTEYDDERPRRRPAGVLVKRGAIAAGVILAAGSVFGATVATTVPADASGDQALDESPSRPWLDQPASAVPVPGPTAATGVLDPGEAVDREWMNAAFPTTTDAPAPTSAPSAPSTGERSSSPTTAPPTTSTPSVERGGGAPSTADAGPTTGPEAEDEAPSGGQTGESGSDEERDEPSGGGNGNGNTGEDEETESGLVGGLVGGLADTVGGLL